MLSNYDNPSEAELEAAFGYMWHSLNGMSRFERLIVQILYWKMGDRLLIKIAQRMHGLEMRTLHRANHGMYRDWFRQQRIERRKIQEMGRGFVKATIVE